ncbi:hypothetical protein CASFOL_006809 [Castilleja foliolosa]|uniref:F-box associated beta-propeller type 1 domain-containing protein n=1 Tax=Castilleja foliolosa TaxID=1961234 RepID=A0ABD3E7I7_9LAMI
MIITMGSKGMFFNGAHETISSSSSSKLIRYNNNNNKISNNSFIPCSRRRYTPKPPHAHHVQQDLLHMDHGTRDNYKLLYRQHNYMNEGSDDVYSFFMLSPDHKNGRCFSLEKNYYCLPNHRFEKRSYPSRILGSFNGILCLEDQFESGNVVLWNPVTDELKSLPPSCIEPTPDVSNTFFSSGFGFDARSGDYKVLRSVQHRYETCNGQFSESTHHFELYSLKNDSWRPILNPVDVVFPPLGLQTNVNGFCYMAFRTKVLSFDFADEVFSALPLPPVTLVFFLCGIDGSTLHIIDYKALPMDIKRFDIWSWKSSEWRWSKVDSFVLEGVDRPLSLWGRDKCFLEGNNHQLLLFDLTTRELKPLGIKDYPVEHPLSFMESKLVPFVESTVSIKQQSKTMGQRC